MLCDINVFLGILIHMSCQSFPVALYWTPGYAVCTCASNNVPKEHALVQLWHKLEKYVKSMITWTLPDL